MLAACRGIMLSVTIKVQVAELTRLSSRSQVPAGESSSLVAAKADAAGSSSQTDSFVPANADANSNIIYVREEYDMELPISAGFNPNIIGTQRLCAKTQFDSGLLDQDIGGWSRGPGPLLPKLQHKEKTQGLCYPTKLPFMCDSYVLNVQKTPGDTSRD